MAAGGGGAAFSFQMLLGRFRKSPPQGSVGAIWLREPRCVEKIKGVQYLRVQKDILEGKLKVVNVGTDANPADPDDQTLERHQL